MNPSTLWLPDGYSTGTIVYNTDNVPFEAGPLAAKTGANIRNITEVTKEYAEARIRAGAQKLVATK